MGYEVHGTHYIILFLCIIENVRNKKYKKIKNNASKVLSTVFGTYYILSKLIVLMVIFTK